MNVEPKSREPTSLQEHERLTIRLGQRGPKGDLIGQLIVASIQLGRIGEALGWAGVGLQQDVGGSGVRVHRADIAINNKWWAEAAHDLAVVALDPDVADAVVRRRLAHPELISAWAEADSGTEPDGDELRYAFDHANSLLDAGDVDQAEHTYLWLSLWLHDSAPLYCKLADLEGRRGNFEEAIGMYRVAEILDREFVWGPLGRAALKLAAGDVEGAESDLERATQTATDEPSAKARIGQLHGLVLQHKAIHGPLELIRLPANAAPPTELQHAGAVPRRTVVAAWDVAHNPVGRAALLADLAALSGPVELVGPLFPDFGHGIWKPLEAAERWYDTYYFAATDPSRLIEGMLRLVLEHPADVVWVSKPRFPSLLLGLLYKVKYGARVICDVDDDELSFARDARPMDLDEFAASFETSDWNRPYANRWIQLARSMADWVDGFSACNELLADQWGATLVPHARNELTYEPRLHSSKGNRARYGLGPDDVVVLFLGTPRRHKGLLRTAQALVELNNPGVVLCVIGSFPDPDLEAALLAVPSLRVSCHPDQPLSEAPGALAMADLVCVVQDPSHQTSQWQTPAKVTDALAMGTAVVGTEIGPLKPFIDAGVVYGTTLDTLAQTIKRALSENQKEMGRKRRQYFVEHLSYGRVAAAAKSALDLQAIETKGPVDSIEELLAFLQDEVPGNIRPAVVQSFGQPLTSNRPLGPLTDIRKDLNVVMFWKQNDSGIYGRRQDMLLEQMARTSRIRRVLHIDAPMSIDKLRHLVTRSHRGDSEASQVVANTVARHMGAADDDNISRKVFLHSATVETFLGQPLPPRSHYGVYVHRWIRELDMRDNTMAWLCPVSDGFNEVHDRLNFPFVAVDVIDDERQWPMDPDRRARIDAGYDYAFETGNVFFANCEPVREWLGAQVGHASSVPNGLVVHSDVERWKTPLSLRGLRRPIAGYIGNMKSRFDWPLLGEVARSRPDVSFVLIGAFDTESDSGPVLALPNVHHLGVIGPPQSLHLAAAFDVAIMPHEISTLSERMNPLKLYVYRSVGTRVVATPVANAEDISSGVEFAATPAAFAASLDRAIEASASGGRLMPDISELQTYSWDERFREILRHIDAEFPPQAGHNQN